MIKIYYNNRIKTRYYLQILTPETAKLFWSTKSKKIKDKSGENVPHIETIWKVLVDCNIVTNNDQQDYSRVLYTFLPNKTFGQLLDVTTQKCYIFKIFWFRILIYWSMVYWSKF